MHTTITAVHNRRLSAYIVRAPFIRVYHIYVVFTEVGCVKKAWEQSGN